MWPVRGLRTFDVRQAARSLDPALVLQSVPGWGPRHVARLAESLGDADTILASTDATVAEALDCSPAAVRRARGGIPWSDLGRESRLLRRLGASVVSRFGDGYPRGWVGMIDPPVAVRVRGDPSRLRDRPGVAIVGARRCTAISADLAARFAIAFAEAGWIVVSGGARGIDAAAHRAALRVGAPTIAVLGSGLARPYPPEHAALFDEIAERGAVVSEFPCTAEPRPGNFPIRNRLVAAFGPGTVMVEAGARSGALITARLAVEDYGREVVAVPGRADLADHAGCHRAIREGWATLVDEPDQAIELLSSQWGLIMSDVPPTETRPGGFR